MADPESENPSLVRQHVEKNRMGDRKLAQKPGVAPRDDGNPEEPQKVKDREPQTKDRKPDKDETYRGRQGSR